MLKGDILVIAALIGIALCTYFVRWGWDYRTRELEAMTGTLEAPDVDFSKPFEINFGSNRCIINANKLREGFDLRTILAIGHENTTYEYPMSINIKDNKIQVSAIIRNEDGEIVVKIVDNEWTINEDNFIARDRNYNDFAFEVINSDLLPVLQVKLEENNNIFIGGLFYLQDTVVFASPEGIIVNPSPERLNEKKTDRIFEYPSIDHLHQMRKTN